MYSTQVYETCTETKLDSGHNARDIMIIFIGIFRPSVDVFPREFKHRDIQNWVQIISPCSRGLARCHVTRTAL